MRCGWMKQRHECSILICRTLQILDFCFLNETEASLFNPEKNILQNDLLSWKFESSERIRAQWWDRCGIGPIPFVSPQLVLRRNNEVKQMQNSEITGIGTDWQFFSMKIITKLYSNVSTNCQGIQRMSFLPLVVVCWLDAACSNPWLIKQTHTAFHSPGFNK